MRANSREIVTPTGEESLLAREAWRRLSGLSQHDLRVRLSGTDEDVTLPASAVRLLVGLLTEMAEGNALELIPIRADLSTRQAAEILGVSRSFLLELLDEGKLPHFKVGTHRRILSKDLLSYKREIDGKRFNALDELAAQAQELDMGY